MDVKGLLVMDVDGTLVQEEGIDLLAHQAGVGEKVARLTSKTMNGHLDFSSSLRKRVSLLKGLETSVFANLQKQIKVNPGAEQLIKELHQRGYKVGLVSGGFHELIDLVASALEIDLVCANRLESKQGYLTGRVYGPIVTPEGKKEKLLAWANQYHLRLNQTVAMGDGANDLPMIEAAGIGIAFMAKPIVAKKAPYRIEKRDLSQVLKIIAQHGKDKKCTSF